VKTLLRKLTQSMSRKSQKARAPFRPALEGLEDRTVPAVTFHGGAVLSHVKVQALFVGVQWKYDPALTAQAQYLSGALGGIVNSSYMDALTNAGYGVGRGSVAPSMIDPSVPLGHYANGGFFLNDSTIRAALTGDILDDALQRPDANTLYVCFVEPNVAVERASGNSAHFIGYHDSFSTRQLSSLVRYVVVPYPGGTIGHTGGNARIPFLSSLDGITTAVSREVADAVTDPDIQLPGYRRGWYDPKYSGTEVGDIAGVRAMYVNGYAMQRLVNKDDFVMTPAQAAPNRAVNFVLQPNGNLVEVTPFGSGLVSGAVAAVSDQGIDNHGYAMVDIVTADGRAFEIHDTGGPGGNVSRTYLASNVKSAKAGQGISYVLYTNGNLYEFDDATGVARYLRGSVTQIDAGTDYQGVNAVDVIASGQLVAAMSARVAGLGGGVTFVPNNAYQYSDDTGGHFIASGVQSISAGRQGFSAYVTTGGDAWGFGLGGGPAGGEGGRLASGVTRAVAGTDPNGAVMYDLLFSNGDLQEERAGIAWYTVATKVTDVTKGRLGAVDLVRTPDLVVKMSANVAGLGGGIVYHPAPQALEHTLSGWRFLLEDATTAV
jgi:hypothetical protein